VHFSTRLSGRLSFVKKFLDKHGSTAGSIPQRIAVDPTGKFVYLAINGSNNVSAYAIDPSTGALSAVSGSPFAAARGLRGVAIATVTGP